MSVSMSRIPEVSFLDYCVLSSRGLAAEPHARIRRRVTLAAIARRLPVAHALTVLGGIWSWWGALSAVSEPRSHRRDAGLRRDRCRACRRDECLVGKPPKITEKQSVACRRRDPPR